MKNNLLLKCDCGGEMLEVVKEEGYYEISLWRQGGGHLSWKERARWIWRILTTGNPWTDQLILSKEKISQLVDFLVERKETDDVFEENKKIFAEVAILREKLQKQIEIDSGRELKQQKVYPEVIEFSDCENCGEQAVNPRDGFCFKCGHIQGIVDEN